MPARIGLAPFKLTLPPVPVAKVARSPVTPRMPGAATTVLVELLFQTPAPFQETVLLEFN